MPKEIEPTYRYARMWPRDVFYRRLERKKEDAVRHGGKTRLTSLLFRTIELLAEPGVYILYWDDVPYYVGTAKRLRARLWAHACVAGDPYFNHWNYFSAFGVEDEFRSRLEGILIAAMPTANGTRPLKRAPVPREMTKMLREMRIQRANPELRPGGRALMDAIAAEGEERS